MGASFFIIKMKISWWTSFCRQKSSVEHSAACKLQVLTNLYSSAVLIWFLSDSVAFSAMQFPQRGTTALPAMRTSLGRQSDKRVSNLRAPQDDPTPSNSLTPFQNSQTARRSLRPIGTQSQQQPTTSEASWTRSRSGTRSCSLERRSRRSRRHRGQVQGPLIWVWKRGGRSSIWRRRRSCSNYRGTAIVAPIPVTIVSMAGR